MKNSLRDRLDVEGAFQIGQRGVVAVVGQDGEELLLGGVVGLVLSHQEGIAPRRGQVLLHLNLARLAVHLQAVVHAYQRETPVGTVFTVICYQRRVLAVALFQMVRYQVTLHGARPIQSAVLLELHKQDVHGLAVRVSVSGQPAVLLHMVAETGRDIRTGQAHAGALVDLVQQLAHKAREARLVERLLEDVADQLGGFGLVHGDSTYQCRALGLNG